MLDGLPHLGEVDTGAARPVGKSDVLDAGRCGHELLERHARERATEDIHVCVQGRRLDAIAKLQIADVLGLRRAAAQIVEAREMHAVVAARVGAHVIGDLVGRADGARGLGLLELRALMRVGEGEGLVAAVAGPGAVRNAHGAVPETQRIRRDRLVRVVLDGAAHLLLLDAEAGIEHPLVDAPVIRGEQRDIAARVVVDQRERRGAGEAVLGDDGAVVQGEVDQARVRASPS